jgi:eukaryotic-like serine/threonine-protein kinase
MKSGEMSIDTDEGSVASPVANLRGARPAADRLEMEAVRARAERALFGDAEPARLGRYVLLGRIAGGGMGVVHAAYDPELHRKVALKVLHPSQYDADRGHHRLISEARALAKLDHPHVVKVHDVMTYQDQVMIVMELVEGQTLAEWQEAKPRSWREIVAVYLQAGEGLAAAHAVKVIHRDFKPANAIVGEDGRVRVLDFGLARVMDGDPASLTSVSHGSLGSEIGKSTAPGAVSGTLAYTAPEQLSGSTATPASDQFSFCVSLHRAIEGVAPFGGNDLAGLKESIRQGVIAYTKDGRIVPKWLRATVARGLSASPAERHPSMRALLDQLGKERGWRRWRGPLMAATVATVASVIAVVLRGEPGSQIKCDGGPKEIASVWGGVQRGQIHRRMASISTPYAREVEAKALTKLDAYADEWARAHDEACEAHRRGHQSSEMLDKRMLCLRRRRLEFSATVQVLGEIKRDSVTKVPEVVAKMSPITECSDVEALNETGELPPKPLRAQVEAVRNMISQAEALERVGRVPDALASARAAALRARDIDYPPVLVETALLEGRILLFNHDYKAAVAPLTVAESLALTNRLYAAAVEAAARRIYCEGVEGADAKELERAIELVDSLSQGLRGDHFARPLLLNNVGVLYMANSQRERARHYFEAARKTLASVERPALELMVIDRSLAWMTPERELRESLIRNVWERLRKTYGAPHLFTLETLEDLARLVVDPAVAVDHKTTACKLYDEFHPTQITRRANCASHRAFLLSELGDEAAAEASYQSVVALTAGTTERDAAVWGHLAAGAIHIKQGRTDAAIAELGQVVAQLGGSEEWWERQWATHGLLGLGIAEHKRGHDRVAAAHLERAAAAYEGFTKINEDVENHQRLALSRLVLAKALRRLGARRDEADRLETQAMQFYRVAGARSYERRLAGDLPFLR